MHCYVSKDPGSFHWGILFWFETEVGEVIVVREVTGDYTLSERVDAGDQSVEIAQVDNAVYSFCANVDIVLCYPNTVQLTLSGKKLVVEVCCEGIN
jgi:hypothetical protein